MESQTNMSTPLIMNIVKMAFYNIWNLIMQNTAKVAFICLFLQTFLSFLPMIISSINIEIELQQSFPDVTLKQDYSTWLLINVIATIPVMFEYCLDLSTYYHDRDKREFGIYRLAIIFSIILPNTIMYLLILSNNNSSVIMAVKYEINVIQTSNIFSFLMLSMFCTKFTKTCEKDYALLKEKLSVVTMIFMITLLISRIIYVLKVTLLGHYHLFVLFSDIVYFSNSCIIYYAIFSVLYYNVTRKVYDVSRFGDFLHSAPYLIQFVGETTMMFFDTRHDTYLCFQLAMIQVICIVPSQYNLCQAQVNAEKLKLKLNLLRYVSHEMRTPLNIAILGTKLATENLFDLISKLKSEQTYQLLSILPVNDFSYYLKRISELCDVAVSTLDDVLTFDKLDEKKLTLEKEICNPWLLIQEVCEPFEVKAKAVNIAFDVKCLPRNNMTNTEGLLDSKWKVTDDSWLENFEFSCDKHKISRVLYDLISKAFVSTPHHGNVTITLEWSQPSIVDNNNRVKSTMIRIVIRYSGQGVVSMKNTEVASQYAGLDISANRYESGLQLWIDRNIVEMHGGRMRVHSLGRGHGSTFVVELPITNVYHYGDSDGDVSDVMYYTASIECDANRVVSSNTFGEISANDVQQVEPTTTQDYYYSKFVQCIPFSIVHNRFSSPSTSPSLLLNNSTSCSSHDRPTRYRLISHSSSPSTSISPFVSTPNTVSSYTMHSFCISLKSKFFLLDLNFLQANTFIFSCMVCYCLFSVILVFMKVFRNIPNDSFFDIDQNLEFLEFPFQGWFLLTIFSVIPMLLNWIFDCFHNSVYGALYISYKLGLIVGLIVPNILIYVSCKMPAYQHWIYYIMFQADSVQCFLLVTSLLCLILRCDNISNVESEYFKLKINISKYLPSFLVLFLVAKILFVSITAFNCHDGSLLLLVTLSSMFETVAVALALYMIGRVLLYHVNNFNFSKVESHRQLKDFLHSILLFAYLVITVFSFACVRSAHHTLSYHLYYSSLFVITVLLTVIPSRCYLHMARINEEKILIRANLISYLSREMKRPINNAIYKACKVSVDSDAVKMQFNNMGIAEYNAEIETIQDVLKDVLESCKVSELTLDDLLVLDQLDDKKLTIDMENVNPWELVQSVASPFSVVAKLSNINYTIKYSENSGNVTSRSWHEDTYLHSDRFKISQVIRNLISNALKFTPEGGTVSVVVDIRHAIVDEDEVMSHAAPVIRIIVTDSGAGISAENQKKMFGQYIQFNAAALQKGKGSGLGLWISKNIVELHGGKLTVHSEGEGYGSSFIVELPGYVHHHNHNYNHAVSDDNGTSSTKVSHESFIHTGLSSKINHSDSMKKNTSLVPRRSSFANVFDIKMDKLFIESSTSTKNYLPQSLKFNSSKSSPYLSAKSTYSVKQKNEYKFMLNNDYEQRPQLEETKEERNDIIPACSYILSTPRVYKRISPRSQIFGTPRQSSLSRSHIIITPCVTDGYTSSCDTRFASSSTLIPFSAAQSVKAVSCLDRGSSLCANEDTNETTPLQELQSSELVPTIKFLVVDDSASSRKMVSRLLIRSGNEVTEANDGLRCLKLLFQTDDSLNIKYDVILIDDAMPNMNGPETILKLRHRGYTGLVIGLTGSIDVETFDSFISSGANEVLVKPLDMSLLDKYLKKYLG